MSALITGEIVYLYFKTDFLGLVIISVVLMIFLATLFRVAFKYGKIFCMFMSVILVVMFLAGYKNVENFSKDIYKISEFAGNENNNSKKLKIYGRIYNIQEKTNSIYIYVDKISLKEGECEYKKVEKLLLVYWKESLNVTVKDNENNMLDLQTGRYISAIGEWSDFSIATNEGGFDEKSYYYSLGIQGKMMVSEYRTLKGEGVENLILNRLYRLKLKLSENLSKVAEAKYAGIYQGILLGDKSNIESSILDIYRLSGISHILSISGLHISLIGYFIYKNLRRYRGFLFSVVISDTIIIAYSYMIGAGFSTKRAVIMFIISMFAKLCGRTYDLISALSLSAIWILAESPMAINNTGFLLSFLAIIGICPLAVWVTDFLNSEIKIIDSVSKSFFTCVSVNVMLLPVLINSYNEMSLYSPVINIIILSFVSVMVGLGFAGLIISFISVGLGKIIIYGGCKILDIYEFICEIMGRLPNSLIIVSDREICRIIIYYVFIVIFMAGIWFLHKKSKLKLWKKYIFVVINLVLIFILITYTNYSETEIKMLDVGQGDSIFISNKGQSILIDAGSSSEKEVVEYIILPFLKSNGISKIDYLILTHSDSDHANGFKELLEYEVNGKNYVKNLIMPDISEDVKDDLYREIDSTAKKQKINVIYFAKGDSLMFGNMGIKCLWPIRNAENMDKNFLSMVLKLTKGEFSILFTGDLTKEAEKALLDMDEDFLQDTDILKVAHHGSNDSSCRKFLEEVSSDVSLISCGRDNSYGHPGEETIKRLTEIGNDIYVTTASGQVSIIVEENSFRVESFLQ